MIKGFLYHPANRLCLKGGGMQQMTSALRKLLPPSLKMNSFCRYRYFSNIIKPREINNSVENFIKTKISLSGPISVAEYMKIVLTSQTGYYMVNDVFGKKGDFVTSPEISQLFGEMIGVWAVNELTKLKSPRPLQIVELGPGRGSMSQDILKVFSKLGNTKDVSIHLVEVSPVLSKIQSETLCKSSVEVTDKIYYKEGVTANNVPIYWYQSVKDLPNYGFTCLFANEFFDALPVHKFQKIDNSWKEILIDFINSELRFVLSKNPTPALALIDQEDEKRDHIEVCPEAGVIMETLANKFEQYGGMALIIDYGHSGEKTDTFRAFKNHKLHDPLVGPGTADLTVDVDFSFLKKIVKNKLITFGPVSQAEFFNKMHIETRLKVLLEKCKSEDDKRKLTGSFDMLMSKEQMGERFKVMSFFPAVLTQVYKKYHVEGFQEEYQSIS